LSGEKTKSVTPAPSRFCHLLLAPAYPLGRFIVLPTYFGSVEVTGQEHLPQVGPVILAPTHRSRWDSLMVPYAAGHHVTGRHLRYMVSADEVAGLQGWFIRRMGGFPIDTLRPAIASLRHGVELMHQGEMLVIFPEGNIFREKHQIQPLKAGLARLAIQAEASHPHLGLKVVPMAITYSDPLVGWRCQVKIQIAPALQVADYDLNAHKIGARQLTADLQQSMEALVKE